MTHPMPPAVLAFFLGAPFALPALAQSFPSKIVRVIVPSPAGSTVDLFARPLARELSATWGLPVLIENLKNAYPASFQPVSQAAIGLGDYQLGWTLWVVLGVSLVGLPFLRFRRPAVLVALATLGLLAVLEPIPGVYDKFWLGVPKAVADLTFMWPMQRLYAILAALVAFLRFDGERRNRTRIQTLDRDGFACFFAIAVSTIVKARERGINFCD